MPPTSSQTTAPAWPWAQTWPPRQHGQNFTMTSGGSTGYPHQAVPYHPKIPNSTFSHNVQTILLLFLSSLQTLMAPSMGRLCGGGQAMWQWAGRVAVGRPCGGGQVYGISL